MSQRTCFTCGLAIAPGEEAQPYCAGRLAATSITEAGSSISTNPVRLTECAPTPPQAHRDVGYCLRAMAQRILTLEQNVRSLAFDVGDGRGR